MCNLLHVLVGMCFWDTLGSEWLALHVTLFCNTRVGLNFSLCIFILQKPDVKETMSLSFVLRVCNECLITLY